MSGIIAAVAVSAISTGVSIYSQRKAAKKARKQAKQDAIDARKAEVFAETTGEGQGDLGQIDTSIDNTANLGRISRKSKNRIKI